MKRSIMKAFGALALTGLLLSGCGNQTAKKVEPAAVVTQQPKKAPAPKRQVTPVVAPTTPSAQPVVKTEAEIMKCVYDSLEADGLKADKRTLAAEHHRSVGTIMTINGVKVALKKGDFRHSLCKGPSTEERLAATEAKLADVTTKLAQAESDLRKARVERDSAYAQINELRPLAYIDSNGPATVENTWKDRVRAVKVLARLMAIALVVLLVFVAVAGVAYLRRPKGIRSQPAAGFDPA